MKKKMVILVCLLLGIMLIGSIQVAAQENIKLDLPQAIEMALVNNLEFQKAAYQSENAEINAKRNEAENRLTQSNLLERQNELSLIQEKEQYQQKKEDLIIQVVDEYLQLKLVQKDLQVKERTSEMEKNILEDIKAQVKAGYKVELDVLEQSNEYYNALFSFESAKLDYQKLLGNFQVTLGLNSKSQFELVVIDTPGFIEIQLDEALQKGRQNSVALQMSNLEIDLASLTLEKSKVSDTPEIDLNELENNLAMTRLDYQIAQQNLDYQIQSQWQNYVQTKNDITLSQNSLNQIKENKTIISNQVKAGLASEDEELSAIVGVLEAEYRLASSVRNYYNALLNLQSIMGNLNKGDI
ncbi:MAG TPA: TolC family protein [Candidatus Glassbacteria bacterium]|nr:TolC family protein [Candidatus Glassbacteria bacterium]